jgi:hypothetical protein
MEIRIAYHPSSDTLMNRISELLKANGIAAELTSTPSTAANNVRITYAKEEKSVFASSLLESSFVHTGQQPGY